MKSFDAVIMIRLRHKPMQHTLDKDGVVLRIILFSFSGCRYKSYSCSIRGLFGSAFFYEVRDPSGAPLPLQSCFLFLLLSFFRTCSEVGTGQAKILAAS